VYPTSRQVACSRSRTRSHARGPGRSTGWWGSGSGTSSTSRSRHRSSRATATPHNGITTAATTPAASTGPSKLYADSRNINGLPRTAPVTRYSIDRQGHPLRRNRVGRIVSASNAVRTGMSVEATGHRRPGR
jgi:hypothetical protein